MKRLIFLLGSALLLLVSFAIGQFQVQPQIDQRTGPIYPQNPSYNFHSMPANYDPYQFNWGTGHWDYVPIPYIPAWQPTPAAQPYIYNWNGNRPGSGVDQSQSPGVGSVPVSPNPANSNGQADDSALWNPPTTQPEELVGPKVVTFQGRIVGIRAVELAGAPYPHLLLRLHSSNGAKGTVDVGERLQLPELSSGSDFQITVTGKLGVVDGSLVIFADNVNFGSHAVDVKRQGGSGPAK
jgi:hypothetical protein